MCLVRKENPLPVCVDYVKFIITTVSFPFCLVGPAKLLLSIVTLISLCVLCKLLKAKLQGALLNQKVIVFDLSFK
jgi:hypothetical protein